MHNWAAAFAGAVLSVHLGRRARVVVGDVSSGHLSHFVRNYTVGSHSLFIMNGIQVMNRKVVAIFC